MRVNRSRFQFAKCFQVPIVVNSLLCQCNKLNNSIILAFGVVTVRCTVWIAAGIAVQSSEPRLDVARIGLVDIC
jgi:hypothetical protein